MKSNPVPRNDDGKMTPRLPAVTTMREEAVVLGVRASPDVIDRVIRNPTVAKLYADQRRKVAVRLRTSAVDDSVDASRALYFGGHLFADLERSDANVRTDRHDEPGRIMGERHDCGGNDPGNGSPPAGVHRGDMTARWVPDEDWDAVGGACGDPVLRDAGDQAVALDVRDRFWAIARGDLSNGGSVHLPLFEETIVRDTDRSEEAFAVLADGVFVVAKMIPEVQRIAGRAAHAPEARCETVAKAMSIQKGRMQDGHTVFHITTTLREPQLRAKKRSFAT